jgi:tetratricopeptide (TPR) repeat protein/predicted Ser/Thr protein kinase
MSDDSTPKPSDPAIKEISGRIGKYEVVNALGKGAMGMVYLARDTVLERDVALKVMVAGIADDPELKMRFEREAKAVAKMTHPNVVMVFDLGYHTDGSPFIAMELLKGMDLQKAMREGTMSIDRKIAVIVQVLAGLAHAHHAGIIHRDIKPANIFLNTDGSVKIMDFGVARLTTASMTGTGSIVGTADYMSPEQVKGAKVDGRSDVFSVGCMLYELLAGRRPFRADNLMAIFYRITHEAPDWSAISAGLQAEAALLPFVQKALSKNLDERYQTAYEFAVDLRDYLKHHATSASGEHALEHLGDLEAPTSGGAQGPMTDRFGETVVEGTVDLGTGPGTRQGTQAGTRRGGTVASGSAATVAGTRGGSGPTVVTRDSPRGRVTRRPMTPRPVASGSPVIYSVLGGMAALLVVAAGFIYWTQFSPSVQQTPPPTTMAAVVATPPPHATPVPTATPKPVPTVAPTPTPLSPSGKATQNLNRAQAAFSSGDYDKATSEAQAALRLDPGNKDAAGFLDNARKGQQAQTHFAAAQTSLRAEDLEAALREAQAGSDLAPWDARGPRLMQSIDEAQRRAEAAQRERARVQAAQQVKGLLDEAQGKLSAKDYAATIALADKALALDPGNATATQLKTGAVTARAVAEAAVGVAPTNRGGGKSFIPGKTSTEHKKAPAVPPGFRTDSGVSAQAATQHAAMPGRVEINVTPNQVKPGDAFTIRVRLHNEGTAPIRIDGVSTELITNLGRTGGAVRSLVAEVAPRQDAVVLEAPGGIWREDYTSFEWVVRIRTAEGSSYRNEVVWK